jgi:REP element-mobilizing transposase RayT
VGREIFSAFAIAKKRFGLRLTHFSIQSNHLHLLLEAPSTAELSRGMQGICIRVARGINRALARSGGVFSDRYHSRALKSPLEVRRALLYVMNNYRRHLAQAGGHPPRDWADPYSSVDYFDGFRALPCESGRPRHQPCAEFALGRAPPVVPARSWLLGVGWRRRGLLSVSDCPSVH